MTALRRLALVRRAHARRSISPQHMARIVSPRHSPTAAQAASPRSTTDADSRLLTASAAPPGAAATAADAGVGVTPQLPIQPNELSAEQPDVVVSAASVSVSVLSPVTEMLLGVNDSVGLDGADAESTRAATHTGVTGDPISAAAAAAADVLGHASQSISKAQLNVSTFPSGQLSEPLGIGCDHDAQKLDILGHSENVSNSRNLGFPRVSDSGMRPDGHPRGQPEAQPMECQPRAADILDSSILWTASRIPRVADAHAQAATHQSSVAHPRAIEQGSCNIFPTTQVCVALLPPSPENADKSGQWC